jgi:hypothetical protein
MNSFQKSLWCLAICVGLLRPMVADEGHDHGPAAGEKLGTVKFQTSCSSAVRSEYGKSSSAASPGSTPSGMRKPKKHSCPSPKKIQDVQWPSGVWP